MSTIELEKNFAIELIETNLTVIKNDILAILKNWNQDSAMEMIERTRRGDLPEAELDAIALTNLLEKQKHLEDILKSIGE